MQIASSAASFIATTLVAATALAVDPPAPAPAPTPGAPPGPAAAPPPSGPAPAQGAWSFGTAAPAPADAGQAPSGGQVEKKPRKLAWRGTSLSWTQSASTETVGIGQDIQSRNPTYDMQFSFGPRYIVFEDDDQNVGLRGAIGIHREFTNSDGTTQRGEWNLDDASLTAAYARTLYEKDDVSTGLTLRAPNLSFPTSKSSANNGKILGIGAGVGVSQGLPLLGSDADVLQTLGLTASAGYSHTITEATTPTNSDLDYVRLTPDGRALPSDQLSGALRAKHGASFSFGVEVGLASKVSWSNSFNWNPAWKYQPTDADVCADELLPTGCATPERTSDPQTFSVVTGFTSSIGVAVIPEMAVEAGYTNATLQNGPDGQHRNIFYSPDAQVFLSVVGKLDKIYQAATPDDSQTARTPARVRVARRSTSTAR